jgi:hypothetical protein
LQRKIFFLNFFTLLIFSLSYAQEDEKTFSVPSVETEIVIDGKGNEVVWEKAEWQTGFWMWRPTDSLQANKQTRFKVLRNNQYLFFLIESDIIGTNFTTPNLKRDFSTWGSDYITLRYF